MQIKQVCWQRPAETWQMVKAPLTLAIKRNLYAVHYWGRMIGENAENSDAGREDKGSSASDLTVRDYRHTPSGAIPRHWVRGDPFATGFFNCLSAVFPEGERFMIHAMARYAGKLSPKLNADLRNFIKQEAAHSREHDEMNAALTSAGYDISDLERVIKQLVDFFADKSDLIKLTGTVCIEHLTAIMAAELLEEDSHLEGADAEQLPIWIWHAVEEVEHKSVAFECWDYATREMGPLRKYMLRCGLMLPLSLSFLINRLRGQLTLLRQDGYTGRAALWGALRYGFAKGGLGRNVIRPWARFFKPGFHPDQSDDSALVVKGEAMFAQLEKANKREQQEQAAKPATEGVRRAA